MTVVIGYLIYSFILLYMYIRINLSFCIRTFIPITVNKPKIKKRNKRRKVYVTNIYLEDLSSSSSSSSSSSY